MAYTHDEGNQDAPSTRTSQYLEMLGEQAIRHGGWMLGSKVMRAPCDESGKGIHDPADFPP